MTELLDDRPVTLRTVLIVSLTSLAIFLGGMSSGYFLARSEYLPKTEARDKVVNEIKQKVDQLPQQINRDIQEDQKR
ncbi:hypothetical protein HX773_18960 [Pantoea sp. B9002]|uniref:Uncharacterized protein n=1 Tax=Pantoea endophytica TaxID=92488 RepID=A0ABX4SL49_9GAMM|nr:MULTISPECIES: hypothetical protein [Pantoea]NWA62989.1 hypothetical protein [Pantoea sp. B9002]PLR20400.1 hypothetical protein PZBJ_20325 [Pantoea endophytica]